VRLDRFANDHAAQAGEDEAPYEVVVAGPTAGPVRTAAGPPIVADRAIDDEALRPDVLLVTGGLTTRQWASASAFVAALRGLVERSEEVGSI
jgi:transcriptional regulator GlxA family with amidase domain